MQRHLTPTEMILFVTAIISLTLAVCFGKISGDGYIGGLTTTFVYAVGKANGFKAAAAAQLVRETARGRRKDDPEQA